MGLGFVKILEAFGKERHFWTTYLERMLSRKAKECSAIDYLCSHCFNYT